jgi:hypothetical protein
MSGLHPTARALIHAAKQREAPLADEARARVHRSVLRRATALGGAMAAVTSASMTAKASLLGVALAGQLIPYGIAGALAGAALIAATKSAWIAPVPYDASLRAKSAQVSPAAGTVQREEPRLLRPSSRSSASQSGSSEAAFAPSPPPLAAPRARATRNDTSEA